MAILKMFTDQVDLAVIGGNFETANTLYFDPTRVTGAFAMGGSSTATVEHSAASGTSTWYHWMAAKTVTTDSQWDTAVGQWYDASGNRVAIIDIVNGQPQFSIFSDSGKTNTPIINLNQNVLYAFDVNIIVTPTTVTGSFYVNNLLIGTATGPNTTSLFTVPVRYEFSNFDSRTYYLSEGIIADEDTRGFRVRELRPQSFGVDQAWLGTVNDVVDSDLSTGVSTPTNGARVSFGVSNLQNISSGDIINRVVSQTYAQRGATGLTRFNNYFRYPDTTRQDAADISVTTTGAWYLQEFANNPKTAVPWVPADLEGIQIGLRAQT